MSFTAHHVSKEDAANHASQNNTVSEELNALNISDSKMPYGPTVLPDGRIIFCYPKVSPQIEELSVIVVNAKGEEQRCIPLSRDDEGNGFVDIVDIPVGSFYRLRTKKKDGTVTEFVDPAARYLPNGVRHHDDPLAYGQIRDLDAYQFKYPKLESLEEGSLEEGSKLVISQCHVGTRTEDGTFKALTERLKDIRKRGFDAVKLSPLSPYPGEFNWGYDGVTNPYAVSQNYGTPDDLMALVDTAHGLGLRVILDVVYNHFSGDIRSQDLLFGDDVLKDTKNDWGNNINFDNPGFREFMIRNAEFLIRTYHVDGLRLDAAHLLPDDFVWELISRCREINPNTIIIYEGPGSNSGRLQGLRDRGYFNNPHNKCFDNGSWLTHFYATLIPEEYREGYLQEANKVDLAYRVWELLKFDPQSHFGYNHDCPGNRYPHKRFPQELLDIWTEKYIKGYNDEKTGREIGMSAARLYLSIGMLTPGNFVIFNGDEEGVLSSPFPFFQQRLPKKDGSDVTAEIRRNRLTELHFAHVHNEKDRGFLQVGPSFPRDNCIWDGTIEKLEEYYNEGKITEETYNALTEYDPSNPETFKCAKIKDSDLNSDISREWRDSFDAIVKFSRSITQRTGVFPLDPHNSRDYVLHFYGMKFKDIPDVNTSDVNIVAFANITEKNYRVHLPWTGFHEKEEYYELIFNSNQGTNAKQPFFSEENEVLYLNIPPFCLAYMAVFPDRGTKRAVMEHYTF
ncbi:MAG: alpha-amylase family glycosyl hydrolase [Bdellovibrionota bacterium]|jgi:glycosidase